MSKRLLPVFALSLSTMAMFSLVAKANAQDMEVSISVAPDAPFANDVGGYYLSRDLGQFKVTEYTEGNNLTTLLLTLS